MESLRCLVSMKFGLLLNVVYLLQIMGQATNTCRQRFRTEIAFTWNWEENLFYGT